nr:hypothetical protein [Bdellovibrionales bacterium]
MSVSSLKNNYWKHLWLRSEVPLVIFIFLNLVISAVTGYLTPRLITDFYQSLKNDVSFDQHLMWLALLYVGEYINRFLFQLSSHRYIQLLLVNVRKRSFSLWLKAPFKHKSNKKHEEYPLGEVLA